MILSVNKNCKKILVKKKLIINLILTGFGTVSSYSFSINLLKVRAHTVSFFISFIESKYLQTRITLCKFRNKLQFVKYCFRGVATGGTRGAMAPRTSISELNKVQLFQFQTSRILLFTGVQKLYRPIISQFLPCMLQVLDNLRQLFMFSNYIGEIDHFTLDLLKRPDT